MNSRSAFVAAALTAAKALLLTACGSSGSSNETSDTIKGADGGDKNASASTNTSAEPDGARRPEIKLPKSLQVDFTDWSNSDPKLQAIMDDGKEGDRERSVGRLRSAEPGQG